MYCNWYINLFEMYFASTSLYLLKKYFIFITKTGLHPSEYGTL